MKTNKKILFNFAPKLPGLGLLLFSGTAFAATINVPGDYSKIQDAINAASSGDTVLVAPGVYQEKLILSRKTIDLASHFRTTGDASKISGTIIDGGGAHAVIQVESSVGSGTTVEGFTIRNASDGVLVNGGQLNLFNSRVTGNKDGIDYEGGGGVIRNCVFDKNRDDGIDLDGPAAVLIENSQVFDNEDDGIEIRLHDYEGAKLKITIRQNLIKGNGEDGIQLIDYSRLSDRVFRIERNVFVDNAFAAIGMMCCTNTKENYQAASIAERVFLTNNTFVGNNYGVTGGDNVIAVNNIFKDTKKTALKGVNGNSVASYNLFFNNGTDSASSTVEQNTSVFKDPLLNSQFKLAPDSPAVDAGIESFRQNSVEVLNIPSSSYAGSAPDLGAKESSGVRSRSPEPTPPAPEPTPPTPPAPEPEPTPPTPERQPRSVPPPAPPQPGADGTQSVSLSIAKESDDAEERLLTGKMYLFSTDLELGAEFLKGGARKYPQMIGLRFPKVPVPAGSQIRSAHIQFTIDEADSSSTVVVLNGEASDSAAPFQAEPFDLTNRAFTSAKVKWSPQPWPQPWRAENKAGKDQRTPDLALIIQEIVDGQGWSKGNALAIFISGDGHRVGDSFDGDTDTAPTLVITFDSP
ncbi:MAG: right-handed parallel beta-helix repeat-containing protein [Methylococcales bacterium]